MSTTTTSQRPAEPLALSILEVAATLGIGRSSVYNLIDAGQLTAVKIGRRRVIPYAALVAYLDGLIADQAA
jgi:excisionase family DNA binding protein